jgi:AraC-like DNA-binding protein
VNKENEKSDEASANLKNHVYLVSKLGHIFAYSWYPAVALPAFYANLNLSVCGSPLHVTVNGIEYAYSAYVAGQAVTQLRTNGTKAVTLVFYPQNPLYRIIQFLGGAPLALLPRSLFLQFDAQLGAASEGRLTFHEAKSLYDSICRQLTEVLPTPPALDGRLETILQLLDANPAYLQKRLAQSVGISSSRLSHLFTQEIGIDLRRYRLALKIGRGLSIYKAGMQLTAAAQAAGFSDSQHLSNAFKELFGGSPMFFLNNSNVVTRWT